MIVLNGSWKEEITEAFGEGKAIRTMFLKPTDKEVYKRDAFLEKIWKMSVTAFDSPREVQVVVDSNNKLFISFGTFSFVSFQEEPTGLKLPIKCWIHTHPFGKAYFSGTDMKTISTWKTQMLSAIVLGYNEHQTWFKNVDYIEHHTYQKSEYKFLPLNHMMFEDQYQLERVEGHIPSDMEFEEWLEITNNSELQEWSSIEKGITMNLINMEWLEKRKEEE